MSRQLGASIAAGVRGLHHAYPANLLDASTLAHEAWENLKSVIFSCYASTHASAHQLYIHIMYSSCINEVINSTLILLSCL